VLIAKDFNVNTLYPVVVAAAVEGKHVDYFMRFYDDVVQGRADPTHKRAFLEYIRGRQEMYEQYCHPPPVAQANAVMDGLVALLRR
jgi:hypothetical protein